MSRRNRKGLRVARGERYALIPKEVIESVAYLALTDWARAVLIALLAQYDGSNNGMLALPFSQAKLLGISHQWKLYAGLRVLEASDIIVCTRRGHLQGGTKLPSFYGVTWRGLDEPKDGASYDGTIGACPIPSHAWAKWNKPENWDEQVRAIMRRVRGKSEQICPFPKKTPHTPRGVQAAHPVSSGKRKSRSPRGVKETPILAHPVVVTSKTLAVPPPSRSAEGEP
jgi:hypothetical protein